jgi:hypothetical protein
MPNRLRALIVRTAPLRTFLTPANPLRAALRHARPFYWREAALCVPALPALLIAGFLLKQPLYGAVAAGAAFSVGFGAARDLRGRRWAAMGAATLGVALATVAGCTAGLWPPGMIILAGAAAAGCAALALFDEDLWWVVLQMVVALLVAGYYPSRLDPALHRAAAVLVGGAVEMAVVMGLAALIPRAAGRLPPGEPKPPPDRALLIGHTARAAICVMAALWAARALGLSNSYWAAMTAMLVLKPGLSETRARGVARLVGTLIGCFSATGYALAVAGQRPWLIGGMAAAAGAAFALQKAHYATLTFAITATVVLLLTLGRGDVLLNAEHRLIATLLGGVIALAVARLAPHRGLAEAAKAEDRVGTVA